MSSCLAPGNKIFKYLSPKKFFKKMYNNYFLLIKFNAVHDCDNFMQIIAFIISIK